MHPFLFTSDIDALGGGDTTVLKVPHVTDKGTLLAWYAKALQLPEYFGSNWDAFDECLRDLSWIRKHTLVLHHSDLPLDGSPEDQRIYLDVLQRAARNWSPGDAHRIIVAFNPICEIRVRAIGRGD